MRGVGEGHRPWDLGANSSMTNGTVGDLKVADGRYLTLTYKGGEQKVFVPPNAPIITYEKATMADVKKGDHVIVTATHNADESITATRASWSTPRRQSQISAAAGITALAATAIPRRRTVPARRT